jgi:tetratricopeptide (TPR) repeat protein
VLVPARRVPVIGVVLALAAIAWATELAGGESARVLLESGNAAEAMKAVTAELELAPDDAELLELASRAAEAAGSADTALWYARLASRGDAPAKDGKKFSDALAARLAALDPLQPKDRAAVEAYAAALLALGQKAAAKKFYLNAVELFERCRKTALGAKAEAELAKIHGNKKAVEALLESGIDVPVRAKKKRSAEATAREDAKHADWEHAHVLKGDNYTIITDMGIETGEAMSVAMELMNRYYRKVFHVKERGGDTARVTIRVYKTRAEFDDNEDGEQAPGVKGFFRPGANEVATYDTREEGFAPSFLWSTLFHEASHQFTHLIAPGNLIPAWLNEGTASYFEGARLLPNGSVETNLVPEGRLGPLMASISANSPRLESVVTYFQPGSYEGSYYPFGWGLVYFLLNYENAECERIYEPRYREYMLAYKSGATHDVKDRFVEYFVTRVGDPEVKSFADFEKRWKAWILTLGQNYFGPPEKADAILAQARKQKEKQKFDAAIESYRWALSKRPDDPGAEFELAAVLESQKAADAAAYSYRRVLALVRERSKDTSVELGGKSLDRAAAMDLCVQRITKLDAALGTELPAAEATFLESSLTIASDYAGAGRPLVALDRLDLARASFGDEESLTDLRAEIAKASGADPRRWRRIDQGDLAVTWDASGSEFQKGTEGIVARTDVPATCISKAELPDRYSFETRVAVDDPGEHGLFGIVFGANANAMQIVVMLPNRSVQLAELDGNRLKPIRPLGRAKEGGPLEVLLGIEVSGNKVEFFVDGKSVNKRPYRPDELAGGVGLLVQGGEGRFRDVRLRY